MKKARESRQSAKESQKEARDKGFSSGFFEKGFFPEVFAREQHKMKARECQGIQREPERARKCQYQRMRAQRAKGEPEVMGKIPQSGP